MTYEEIKASIPDELDECFMISDYVKELEEENYDE